MNKQRKTSHILNVFQYDADGHVVLPASLTLSIAPGSSDNSSKVPTTAWTRSYVSGLSYLTGNQSITVSGDATGSGTTSIALTLANTAVTPGTYGSTTLVPVVTVDSKGRVTSVTTAAISGSLTFTGDVTGTGTTGASTGLTLAASGVTAGTYTKVTVDSKGRVTVGASATTSDISEGTNLYYTDARVLSYLTTNNYATQSYVGTQIANLVDSSPAALNTLNELAAALGNDASFSTTVSTALGNRLRVDINTQGLTSTQQGYGRTNLGLGTAATSATADFAAASHTHSIANVTGLQTALDGKQASGSYAASVHTHAISDVTGLQTALDGKQASLGFTPYNSTNPSGYISVNNQPYFGINNTSNSSGNGISLYGSYGGGAMNYGLMFAGTPTFGTHGSVSGDWATYFMMNDDATRGWIFRRNGAANVASISAGGNAQFNGTVTAPTFSGALSGNASTASAAAGSSFLTQANATWGARVQLGGNGDPGAVANIAVVQATDGNLHMDNGTGKSMYLNYYRNGIIYLNGGTYYISANGSQYNGNAASASSVAWGNVSSRPTALSQFTNDLGNYGSWAAASHTHTNLYYNSTVHLYTGSDGTRNIGWAYHMDNGTGLHWPNNGWHLYPKDATDMYIRSGGTESSIVLNTQGTNRGYVYVNSSNEIGFLNNSRSWILRMTSSGDLIMDQNYGNSIVGVYSSTRFQGVYSMGNAYKLAIDGTSPGNLYGISWGHPNAGGQAGYLSDHGMMVMVNGVTYAAISNNIWARGTITANAGAYANGNRLVENNGGSWGISITGNAGSASSVAWGNVSGRPGWMTSASLIEAHANANEWRNSGFYENSGGGSNWPSGTWYNSINVRHSNQGNYHGFQVAMSYYDNLLWFRSYQGSGSFQSWVHAISSANIGSQSVNYANSAGSASSASSAGNADTVDGYHLDQGVSTGSSPSFNTIYTSWFRAYGTTGIYQQDYGGHFARSTDASHGTWQVWGGARGGYSGINIIDPQGYWNNLMYENGNGGAYSQNANGWQYYYHRGNNCFAMTTGTTSGSYRAYVGGSLYAEGDIVAYSDARLKRDIVTIDNPIDKVTQMRGVYYTKIGEETKGRQTGVIAQEMNEVLPEVVTYASDIDTYGVSYGNIVGVLIEAIKEQQTQIENLTNKIDLLTQNK